LYEWQSIPLATFITVSPVDNDAIDVENSTTSKPLYISPLASAIVLPCSEFNISANLSLLSLID
jgi:hypothetical protein